MRTNSGIFKFGLVIMLAFTTSNAMAQQNEELTNPSNPIATDSGNWGPSSELEFLSFSNPKKRFWGNFYDTVFLTNIEEWHGQHVVRLPNKDGRAYFMVSQSREHNGYITVLRTDLGVLDPITDLIVPNKFTGTDNYGMKWSKPVGEYVWQEVFTGKYNGNINPHGNWNHPGKMEVIGDVLLVAAQNWTHGSIGTSMDEVLFYDVSNPEKPNYMGGITSQELGVKEISTVALVRAPNNGYLLYAGGDGTYATFAASNVSPNIKDWIKVKTSGFSGQHGMNFNSYQKTARIPGGPANGVERVMYFDASADDHRGSFDFHNYKYDATNRNLAVAGKKSYGMTLPGADRDWDTSSLYVSKNGTPIIYTLRLAKGLTYDLYQVHN